MLKATRTKTGRAVEGRPFEDVKLKCSLAMTVQRESGWSGCDFACVCIYRERGGQKYNPACG